MATVITDAINDLSTIIKYIDAAREYLDSAEDRYLNFDQNNLEEISKKHAKNLYRTSRAINEMKGIEDTLTNKLKQVESKYWKKYNEGYQRALSTQDIKAYISGEPEHVALMELQLEVQFVKRQLEALFDALKDMGWQIKTVTELRIHELQNVVV
jgi:hypothetical protein